RPRQEVARHCRHDPAARENDDRSGDRRGGGENRGRSHQEDRWNVAGMSLAGLIPADLTTFAAIAICAIAFVSGTARGFSGFGSALIFMPLASSMAAPKLVAALLLIIDLVAAAPLLPNAWKQADRKATAVMVAGALIGVPIGTYMLTRLEPVTTRWIIS